MRTLYFDCGMGAAGDMLTAALLDLLPDPQGFVADFNALGIPNVTMTVQESSSCGIRGKHVHILVGGHEEGEHDHCAHHDDNHDHHDHAHHHMGFDDVAKLICSLPLSEAVRENSLAVYRSIAEAESRVHGRPLSQVHFHELGSMDAVADVTAVCMLIERLAPGKICASPIHVGKGHVHCAHGIMPVPAPATAELLRGIPCYSGDIAGELCTPTGAALLRRFVSEFGSQPLMSAEAVGYGLGSKVFPAANCVRAILGTAKDSGDTVEEICCNLDDMTGEAIGFAMERLLDGGALDVYTIPIGMKKSRPGVMLCCLCKCEDTEKLSALMLKHTSTLGVRISAARRITLEREFSLAQTPYGSVRLKTAGGISKPEYEDLAKIARAMDISLAEAALLIKNEGK